LRAQEAEFLLTQSWDRRPQHVAALLLPHQSAGGSGVLGWALEAPQLPLLCASPWFTKLCLDSVWTRHTLYGTTSARGETYMGEQKTAAGSFPFFCPEPVLAKHRCLQYRDSKQQRRFLSQGARRRRPFATTRPLTSGCSAGCG
jgi:hypothetical protein